MIRIITRNQYKSRIFHLKDHTVVQCTYNLRQDFQVRLKALILYFNTLPRKRAYNYARLSPFLKIVDTALSHYSIII